MSNHHIFMSYARVDNRPHGPSGRGWLNIFVDQLKARHLAHAQRELRVFFDKDEIKNGDDWQTRIYTGLRSSRLFLAVLSDNYGKSQWCMRELEEYLRIEHALARGGEGIRPIYFTTMAELEGKTKPDESIAHLIEALQTRNRDAGLDWRAWRDNGMQSLLELDAEDRLAALKADPDAPLKTFFTGIDALDDAIARRLDDAELAELVSTQQGLEGAYTHFVGRSADMARLHLGLTGNEVRIVTALQGLGGVGKTALARQYGHAYAGYYAAGGRWEVACEGIAHLAGVFDSLAETILNRAPGDPRFAALRLTEAEGKALDPERLTIHLRKLAAFTCDGWEQRLNGLIETMGGLRERPDLRQDRRLPRILIILDNVDRPGLLAANVQQALKALTWLEMIVTTREDPKAIGIHGDGAVIAVDALPLGDAVAMLRSFRNFRDGDAGRADADAALAIARDLDGYTLAVELVGAFLAANPDIAVAAYRTRLLGDGLTTSDEDAGTDEVASQIRHKEKQVGLIVDGMLAGLDDAARTSLHLAAHFPPDLIPERWLRDVAETRHADLGEPDMAGKIGPWQRVMKALLGRRLLTRAAQPETLRLHRVIGAHLRAVAGEAPRARDREEVIALSEHVGRLLDDPETGWRHQAKLIALQPPLLALSEHVLKGGTDTRLLQANGVCADIIGTIGNLTVAIELAKSTLATAEQLVADNPGSALARRDLSVSQNKIGDFYRERGQPGDAAAALAAYEASLATREYLLADNPGSARALRDLMSSLERMGALAADAGDTTSARAYWQRVLDLLDGFVAVGHPMDPEMRQAHEHYRRLLGGDDGKR